MTRFTDVNIKFTGGEPKFAGDVSKVELMQSLNWYSQNKNSKDSYNYACDYFKKKHKIDASSILKNEQSTFGFVCRIVTNGGILIDNNKSWFDSEIERIKNELKNSKTKTKKSTQLVVDTSEPKTNTIQDRIREKANECIAELEGQFDELLISKFKSNVSPYGVFHTMAIKDVQTKYIVDWAKKKRSEFDEVMNTKDKDLKEGYSNFSKVELKKVIAYFDQVILDCQKISGESQKTKKPRKRKVKSPAELVAKMKYQKDYKTADIDLKSIDPINIIGATQLWVYNTKTRKLGVYHAEDAGGFGVKGTTILNFTESKSIQKTLRKPQDVLSKVLTGGKVTLRNLMESVRAVESQLNGRINEDIILMKVVK